MLLSMFLYYYGVWSSKRTLFYGKKSLEVPNLNVLKKLFNFYEKNVLLPRVFRQLSFFLSRTSIETLCRCRCCYNKCNMIFEVNIATQVCLNYRLRLLQHVHNEVAIISETQSINEILVLVIGQNVLHWFENFKL